MKGRLNRTTTLCPKNVITLYMNGLASWNMYATNDRPRGAGYERDSDCPRGYPVLKTQYFKGYLIDKSVFIKLNFTL